MNLEKTNDEYVRGFRREEGKGKITYLYGRLKSKIRHKNIQFRVVSQFMPNFMVV